MPMKVDLTPDYLDLVFYAGDIGDFQIEFKDRTGASINVSTWNWMAQIRTTRDATPYTSLTIDTTSAATGLITVRVPATVTRTIAQDYPKQVGVWDIQGTPSGSQPTTVLQGTIRCSMDVTR